MHNHQYIPADWNREIEVIVIGTDIRFNNVFCLVVYFSSLGIKMLIRLVYADFANIPWKIDAFDIIQGNKNVIIS